MAQKRSKSELVSRKKKSGPKKKVTVTLPTDGLDFYNPSWSQKLVNRLKGRYPQRLPSKVVASIIKQTHDNVESVTLVRSTHNVPEKTENLIFSIEFKQEK